MKALSPWNSFYHILLLFYRLFTQLYSIVATLLLNVCISTETGHTHRRIEWGNRWNNLTPTVWFHKQASFHILFHFFSAYNENEENFCWYITKSNFMFIYIELMAASIFTFVYLFIYSPRCWNCAFSWLKENITCPNMPLQNKHMSIRTFINTLSMHRWYRYFYSKDTWYLIYT